MLCFNMYLIDLKKNVNGFATQDALDARLKTNPPSALGDRYKGGFPPKEWTGWTVIAEDLALDLEDAPFRVCMAAKLAIEADTQNLNVGKVDWAAVENTIQTICYGLSPEADTLSMNPVIVEKKVADSGQSGQPIFLVSFPGIDQKHGESFSMAELVAAFPSRYNEMIDQWNRVQDGQPPQSSAIHENGIQPMTASPLVLQSGPSIGPTGREPKRDDVHVNIRTSTQDGQGTLHDTELRPIPEAANGVIHMFTNHGTLHAQGPLPRTAPRELASLPSPLPPPVPQTGPAQQAVPMQPIKAPTHRLDKGNSNCRARGSVLERPSPFIGGQATDAQAKNVVIPPPVNSEAWKDLTLHAHPLFAPNVDYLRRVQQQERVDVTLQVTSKKMRKEETKNDSRYSLTLLAACCEDSIERNKVDESMPPENGNQSNRNVAEASKPLLEEPPATTRKGHVQQTSLVQSSPLRADKTMPERKGQAVDQPQASLTPPNEVRRKKFGCAPCLGSTPRYKNQNQRDLKRATGSQRRGRPPGRRHVLPLPEQKGKQEEVVAGDKTSEPPATEVSEYVDAMTGSLEIDQVDYRLTADGWKGAVITGAKAVGNDSVDVWIQWPEEESSKRYPSSKLVGPDKVHCMMSLIKFYESKTKKRK